MLFDLRSRGRRTTVKVIYIGLAILLGSGLVLFGVGSFGGTGILSSNSSNESSGGASFSGQVKKYEKELKQNSSDAAAYVGLAKALLHEAGNEEAGYVTNGIPTSKGKELYRRASQAWQSYLALNPSKVDPELAQLVFPIYAEEGLNEPSKAVQALQVITADQPESVHYYAYLAIYAYKAKNESIGDLATKKALSLAPADQRARLQTELEEAKKYPNGGKTYITKTNGKTYAVKKAPNGTFTGTQITSTPAPATGTTTTTTK